MSSIPTPPTPSPESPSVSAPAMDTTSSLPATAGKTIRELPPPAKFGMIGLLLILLVTWYIRLGRVSTDDAEVDAHITAVASSQVSGYVVALPIDDNVNVRAGDVLVQIDPREYRA